MQFMPGRTIGAKIVRVLTIIFFVLTVAFLGATIFIQGRIAELQSLQSAR